MSESPRQAALNDLERRVRDHPQEAVSVIFAAAGLSLEADELAALVPTFQRERKRKNMRPGAQGPRVFQQLAVKHIDLHDLVQAALADHERNADELLYQVEHEHDAQQLRKKGQAEAAKRNRKSSRSSPSKLVQNKPPQKRLDAVKIVEQTGWTKAAATRIIRYQSKQWDAKTMGDQQLRLLMLESPDHLEKLHQHAAEWCLEQQAKRKAEREAAAAKRAESAARVGRGQLRKDLDWHHWIFQLAIEHGLIKTAADGKIEPSEAQRVLADATSLHAQALQFELLNVPSAAKELGCSESIMRKFLAETHFEHDDTGSFRYGTFSLYMRHRIQAAAPALTAWQDQRKSASADKRKGASAKAKTTRVIHQMEAADVTEAVQRRMISYAGIADPLTRTATITAAWAHMVAIHADYLMRAAGRARSDKSRTTKQAQAAQLHELKNQAMQLLARSAVAKISLLDAHNIWLCTSCRDMAYSAGVHPREWYGHCPKCEVTHEYSLISLDVDGVVPLMIPVPLALKWQMPEVLLAPTSADTEANSSDAATGSKQTAKPLTRKQQKALARQKERAQETPRSMLPLWMQKIPVEPRRGGIGSYDATASDSVMRAYNAATSAERLQASMAEMQLLVS